jgi:hypothetical protein
MTQVPACHGVSGPIIQTLTCSSHDFVSFHAQVAATGRPNYQKARIPVPSKLNVQVWRTSLRDYPDKIICEFLTFGWPIGYAHATLPVFDLRNHQGALKFPDSINNYLQDQIHLGRVAGPFQDCPFSEGLTISPLNTVAKRDSSERRIIVDLSWPCGSSVNDGIPRSSFLGEPMLVSYPTVDAIVAAVLAKGKGSLIYKRDLKQAYRQFPVDPLDYKFLGYSWDGRLYFDTVLTMGLRSAAMACQRSTNAVAWLCSDAGLTVLNYLDDFIGVEHPDSAQAAFTKLGHLLSALGLVESTAKASPPADVMVCLGVEFNTTALTLSVSRDRLVELEELLLQWLHKKSTSKRDLQSLIGKLAFVSKCVRQSRLFLSRILHCLRQLKFNHHHINLTAEFRKDILWWCRFLRSYNGVSMIN